MNRQLDDWLAQGLLVLALALLISFSYAYFALVPYAGFNFSRGRIHTVYVTAAPEAGLHVGDELVQVGPVPWTRFSIDLRQTLFDDIEPGQIVPILVRRDAEFVSVPWRYPGFSRQQFLARLDSAWWLPYVFWAFAAATALLVRPKDSRWRLLLAFNLLTAIWLAAGNGPSGWHVWNSALILRAAIWLCIPVYWHLHWLIPGPLGSLPGPMPALAYLGGGTLAVLEWFQILPQDAYLAGFILVLAGSLSLLVAHAFLRPEQRGRLDLLVKVAALVTLPAIGVAVAGLFGGDLRWASLALLGLPFIPGAYLYAVYHQRLGRLELRANRLVALYAYLILIVPAVAAFVTLLAGALDFSGSPALIGLPAAMITAILTIAAFPSFARFVERYVLGISLPPATLLEKYAVRIATSLERDSLAALLRDGVLPSLLVRRSAIILGKGDEARQVLFRLGVGQDELPGQDDILALLAQAGVYRPVDAQRLQPCPWVRLVLPLNLGEEAIGLWLLGRRDPDDFYSQAEIPTWQALAAQTAVAITNIVQAEHLHALYQANIDREERARTHLALALHDEVLAQVTALALFVDKECVPAQFNQTLESLVARCREIIYGLRPATLDYGLPAALHDLALSLTERIQSDVTFQLDLPANGHRYPAHVEQHLYRIVQQAVENALKHAAARTVCIGGRFEAEQVTLFVEDDGKGFSVEEPLDLSAFLARKQFGLAGMIERARLIEAEIQIIPCPGRGTQVRVVWSCFDRDASGGRAIYSF